MIIMMELLERGLFDLKEKKKKDAKEKDAAIKIGIEKVATAAKSGKSWDELSELWQWDDEPSYSQDVQNALDSRFRYCALMGNDMALQFLYNKGAQIDSQDAEGNSALHLAVTPQEEHIERQTPVMEFLMAQGANCDIINKLGVSCKTHVAGVTSEKMVSIVRVLDVKRKPKTEETKS